MHQDEHITFKEDVYFLELPTEKTYNYYHPVAEGSSRASHLTSKHHPPWMHTRVLGKMENNRPGSVLMSLKDLCGRGKGSPSVLQKVKTGKPAAKGGSPYQERKGTDRAVSRRENTPRSSCLLVFVFASQRRGRRWGLWSRRLIEYLQYICC